MSQIYANQLMGWLVEEGYTHCFFVPGGNAMYLIEAARTRFICCAFVHETGAGIAAEYFNESQVEGKRAFVVVTAGPAATNLATPIASAWVECRDLLVLGGQVKTSDLKEIGTRQRGFQEIGGAQIMASISKEVHTIDEIVDKDVFLTWVRSGSEGRKGPVFIEVCLDVSALEVTPTSEEASVDPIPAAMVTEGNDLALAQPILDMLISAERPILLIGGSVSRETSARISEFAAKGVLPIGATFNGIDRVPSSAPFYCGAPNWYGSRWSNAIVQQADLIIAVGTRLGLLETGYNWDAYAPLARIVRADWDMEGATTQRRAVDLEVTTDPNVLLNLMFSAIEGAELPNWSDWKELIQAIRAGLDRVEPVNQARDGFVEFMGFVAELSRRLGPEDNFIPCSSGGSWEGTMRMFQPKAGQVMITDKGLASMGFGLAGAVGVALAHPDRRTVTIEGDGGFSQNLQELGVVANRGLNMKIFVVDNGGYSSIRANQKANFGGNYMGCDSSSGLGLPNWEDVARAYGLPFLSVDASNLWSREFDQLFDSPGPCFFQVKCDPDQVLFPRIQSSRDESGRQVSRPLHEMSPDLSSEERARFLPHLFPS
jgi:acetolactate synthase I/II/III large subunit